MIEIIESTVFRRWVRGLSDRSAVARINARLRNISLGNAGDVKPVRHGLFEIRLHHGPGYRIYVLRERMRMIVLCAGDKDSQRRDIAYALRLAREWRWK
ncbi:MAG: type II toxin-antitoxin system RelE/ParE family toxin [Gemmatimonadetes bacterium]|nr:type II toxin-antitoxin system RelE/ParE family toxin [Gemmatimonadota bacterium]MYH18959.1 type II toxin-antitoxin system RelE/ParE family toxin [Gemmatimonadota bacterium]MYK99833.1 type II toxin-antitoxin system RelE/ParE family toxin [Gemmatimonadota bacterium]